MYCPMNCSMLNNFFSFVPNFPADVCPGFWMWATQCRKHIYLQTWVEKYDMMGLSRLIFDRRIQIRVEPKIKVGHHAEKAMPMRNSKKIHEKLRISHVIGMNI